MRRVVPLFVTVLALHAFPVYAQNPVPGTTAGTVSDKRRSPGSPYVELDSWIYPAIERLAALGYIHSEFLGMRPWTRVEVAHLIEESVDELDRRRQARRLLAEPPGPDDSVPAAIEQLQTSLRTEFKAELDALAGGDNRTVRLESVYTGFTDIAGKPLNDSYHFGQTIINNYGRPYEQGFNSDDGFSGYATSGHFTAYVRGEYQYAPSAPAYSLPVRQLIAKVDDNPLLPPTPVPTANQFRLLDTYVAANAANWNFAFGKQSLWWGPGEGGALLFSDNAEPIYMFRASRVTPIILPSILRLLGPMKLDLFYGKLSGAQYPPRPMIHGEKISFKVTRNLEMGFSRTGELGGVGRALTAYNVFESYVSVTSAAGPVATHPGKRTGGFDFNYRLPFLRDWVSLYLDSLSDDDPSPIDAPRRAGISPGLYFARIPGLPKLDLRIEAVNTDTPTSRSTGGQFIYYDYFYHDLYTDKGNIIGSWIGREGQGTQVWSKYWFSPKNTLQLGYRHAKVASDFITGGETINDASARLGWWVRQDVSVSAFLQYEKWLAPVLALTPQTNFTSSVEVSYWPRSWSW